jgi:hypothetical protein
MKRGGDGKFYRAFTCLEGIRNEALDGRVGTMAIERIVKPNYAKLSETLKEAPAENPPAPNQPFSSDSTPGKSPIIQKAQAGFVGKLRRPGGRFVRGW